jgi:5-methylthioadenosine/S-adenosylhomocysteine deaminase
MSGLARDNVTVVHNPKSNLKLGSGFAPLKEFMDAGVRVALGTDGAASNNRLDLWDEIRFAALMHKGHNLDPTLASAREVLRMATLNGARAMGFTDVGLLREGWRADMMIIGVDNPRYAGVNPSNAPEFAVYSGSSRDVRATIVAGRTLYEDGELRTMDLDKVMAEAKSALRELGR